MFLSASLIERVQAGRCSCMLAVELLSRYRVAVKNGLIIYSVLHFSHIKMFSQLIGHN